MGGGWVESVVKLADAPVGAHRCLNSCMCACAFAMTQGVMSTFVSLGFLECTCCILSLPSCKSVCLVLPLMPRGKHKLIGLKFKAARACETHHGAMQSGQWGKFGFRTFTPPASELPGFFNGHQAAFLNSPNSDWHVATFQITCNKTQKRILSWWMRHEFQSAPD